MTVYTLVALLYLVLSLPLMFGVNQIGKRLAVRRSR
jgi:polar amino acid transport system permease protein